MDNAAILTALKQHFAMTPQSKVLVVGLGTTGVSVAKFLHQAGIPFAITDSRSKPTSLDELAGQMPDIPIFTGGFNQVAFEVATHLVVSPGVSLHEPSIARAKARGCKILGDIDLFASIANAPIIAITGSNGKSTVTTLVGEMCKSAGLKAGVGGNLGTPALDLLDTCNKIYVLELSSFQLERTALLDATAATVLNISADHLDRHADMAEYTAAKQKVFNGDGVMVINKDDPVVNSMADSTRNMLTFSVSGQADFCLLFSNGCEYLAYRNIPLMPLSSLLLEGRHNAANALAALALGTALGLDQQSMRHALQTFKGLAHRMQRVAEIAGITWVNDSKATNIGACIAALQGYDHKVVLIAGGDAKGADMNELAPVVKAKAKGVVLMGKDAPLIEQALGGCVPTVTVNNMLQAVQAAAKFAHRGDSVLLSPACASLDQYKNYQDRGEKFTHAVLSLSA